MPAASYLGWMSATISIHFCLSQFFLNLHKPICDAGSRKLFQQCRGFCGWFQCILKDCITFWVQSNDARLLLLSENFSLHAEFTVLGHGLYSAARLLVKIDCQKGPELSSFRYSSSLKNFFLWGFQYSWKERKSTEQNKLNKTNQDIKLMQIDDDIHPKQLAAGIFK